MGRYEIYAEISSGGMATVHLGRQLGDVGFSRTVAIKRLHPHVAREQEFVEMFLDEARLATRIHDPHVVPTLDVVAEGGELMLVMDYVHGEALSTLLTTVSRRKERVDPRVAVSIAAGMLDGLHAAHEAKNERGEPLQIVHRDVSPQNVLVGADGVSRVFDFGIAKAADRLHITQDGSLKGKVAYMSPEQLENEPIDRRSDVWAASVVLWEMLSGKRLFVADSQAALVRMILMRDVPKVSSTGAPSALDAILARGLAKDPRDRFPTARAMALALEDALPSAPARTVATWVERCASESLAERAKLLGDVDRVAADNRPSGATRIELERLERLGSAADAVVDEDAVTATKHTYDPPSEITAVQQAEDTLVLATGAPAARSPAVDHELATKGTVRISSAVLDRELGPLEATRIEPARIDTQPRTFVPMAPATASVAPPWKNPRIQAVAGVAALTAAVFILAGVWLLTAPKRTPASSEPTEPPATPIAVPAETTAAAVPPAPPPPSPAPEEAPQAASPTPPTPPTAVTAAPTPEQKPPPGNRKPPRPSAPAPAGPAKKCTPLDFDYPACLKR